MQRELELLAPAKNKEIGIAAIDCGADAVYIAAESFGAREAAGNTIEDIRVLVVYAHKYGAKVYVVVNTILYEDEIEKAERLISKVYDIACDAIIIQDLGLLKCKLPPIPLFASTQTNITTVAKAKMLTEFGFSRLILARELSLNQIKEISSELDTPLEAFVHGALCVSYSGQCYLSQKLTGRSANRGACAQACRANYTLKDSCGTVIEDNQALLSLKDFNLSSRIGDLVRAGISSFKIEGRLKNESYVRNIVSLYRAKIDEFLKVNKEYSRASYGNIICSFTPNPNLTFNRGYTQLFIDEKRDKWRSQDGAKYLGEYIGLLKDAKINKQGCLEFANPKDICNGDGLCFVTNSGQILGVRANNCINNRVVTLEKKLVPNGFKIFRNFNFTFEKEIEKSKTKREIPVDLIFVVSDSITRDNSIIVSYAMSSFSTYSATFVYNVKDDGAIAKNVETAKKTIENQLNKTAECFKFNFKGFRNDKNPPFYPLSVLNNIRREIADLVEEDMKKTVKLKQSEIIEKEKTNRLLINRLLDDGANKINISQAYQYNLGYLLNSSNSFSNNLYKSCGLNNLENAYELEPVKNATLMRTKYCLKYQLGLCPKYFKVVNNYVEPLFLFNGKNKLELKFDCNKCEMLIIG